VIRIAWSVAGDPGGTQYASRFTQHGPRFTFFRFTLYAARFTSGVLRLPRRRMDRRADAHVGAAATDIRDPSVNVGISRFGGFG
jgi:hypothetical protein